MTNGRDRARAVPNPERDFFLIDGHPNAKGHAIISVSLVKELTGGAVPALNVPAQIQSASTQGR